MKTITLSFIAIMMISFTSLKQSLKQNSNQENQTSLNLECPVPPAFNETLIYENKKKNSSIQREV